MGRWSLFCTLATWAMAMNHPAQAQPGEQVAPEPSQVVAAQAAADAEGDVQSGGIAEIVVTAQRRAENIQDVPASVSAISSGDLQALRIRDSRDLATQMPNVVIQTPYSESQPIFSIRGVSMSDFSQNQSSPVAMYVDEVFKGVGALQALQLFDVDRVEVLRGPQGTLFGKNTTGGAVSVFTRQPSLSRTEGYLTAGIGNYDRREATGAVGAPLVPGKLAVRAAFTYAEADGYVKDLTPGQPRRANATDDWAFRASVRFSPTDTIDAVLRYGQSRSHPGRYVGFAKDVDPGGIGFFTGYQRDGLGFYEVESGPADCFPKLESTELRCAPGDQKIDSDSASLTINWDPSEAITITSVSSFDKGHWLTFEDADISPFSIFHPLYESRVKAYAQDLRLTTDFEGPLNFILGLYANRERLKAQQVYKFFHAFAGDADGNGNLDCFDDGFTGCTYQNELSQKRDTKAAYIHGTYDFTEQLTLTLGARYTRDNSRLGYYRAFLGFLDPATQTEVFRATPLILAPPDPKAIDENVSVKIGLDYKVNDDLMFYGLFSTGYRGSSFNGGAFFDPSEVTIADPEKIRAWEVGLKSDWLDGQLRFNAAAFYYIYKDQQFIDLSAVGLQTLVNADQATIYGGEAELIVQASEALRLRAGVGYTQGEYDALTLRGLDLSGNDLIATPEWTLNAAADWDIVDLGWGSLRLHGDTTFTGHQFYDAFNNPDIAQDGYWLSNARLTLTTLSDKLDVSFWVKNLTDEKYFPWLIDLQGFGYNYGHRGRPRTYGVEATLRF